MLNSVSQIFYALRLENLDIIGMKQILFFAQIIIPILLIVLILLQQRGTALGSVFGGGDEGGFYLKRRGIEKKIFWSTVALAISFLVISLFNLIIK